MRLRNLGIYLNVAAVVMSAMALGISLHSNFLAGEANNLTRLSIKDANPNLKAFDTTEQAIYIIVTGCKSQYGEYLIQRRVENTITVTNEGGRSSSLLQVEFFEEDLKYKHASLSSNESFNKSSATDKPGYSMAVEPGGFQTWLLEATHNVSYETREEALSSVSELLSLSKRVYWKLHFTGSPVLTKEPVLVWFSINPNLPVVIDRECEEAMGDGAILSGTVLLTVTTK